MACINHSSQSKHWKGEVATCALSCMASTWDPSPEPATVPSSCAWYSMACINHCSCSKHWTNWSCNLCVILSYGYFQLL